MALAFEIEHQEGRAVARSRPALSCRRSAKATRLLIGTLHATKWSNQDTTTGRLVAKPCRQGILELGRFLAMQQVRSGFVFEKHAE
jgi:hypothetical protein